MRYDKSFSFLREGILVRFKHENYYLIHDNQLYLQGFNFWTMASDHLK